MKILMRASQNPFDNYDAYNTILTDRIWTNVGNLLFPYSLYKNLLSDEVEITNISRIPSPNEADKINSEYDALILPFANAFREAFIPQLKRWSALIKKLKIPCVVAGVGFQYGLNCTKNTHFIFDDDVKEFCKAVSEKSAFIGVRGEYTFEYLKGLGFENTTKVIGCPSIYTFGDQLPAIKKIKWENGKLAVNGKPIDKKEIRQYLFNENNNYLFFPQGINDLELLFSGAPMKNKNDPDNIYPSTLCHYAFKNDRVVFPTNVPTWFQALSSCDMSIGTCIHGTIAAVLSGLPAYVIATDSRILELAEYHNICHKSVNEFDTNISIQELYEETDFDSVNKGHKQRYEIFKAFLKENGLKPVEKENNFFENKINEISYYKPLKSILCVSKDEMAIRLNKYYCHLTRKISNLEQNNKEMQALQQNYNKSKIENDQLKEMASTIQLTLNKYLLQE